MTRTRRAVATLLAPLVATLAMAVTAPPAHAVAPVTADDTTSMWAGNGREVEVLANDTDTDSPSDLTVCRLGPETYKRVFAESVGEGVVLVYSLPSAAPGTYTFTYYACDYESLTPGTLTVTIEPEPKVTAKALPRQPGKIKVKNPADVKIKFLYGSAKEEAPDGTVKVPRNSSVILSVRRTRIDWVAYSRKNEFIARGRITGIVLPPGTTPPAVGRSGTMLRKLWTT
jgi:hypothetical protein